MSRLIRAWLHYVFARELDYHVWQCCHLDGCSHDLSRRACQRFNGHFGEHRYE
jgi:hypothetical protein